MLREITRHVSTPRGRERQTPVVVIGREDGAEFYVTKLTAIMSGLRVAEWESIATATVVAAVMGPGPGEVPDRTKYYAQQQTMERMARC